MDPQEELNMLRDEADALQDELASINRRIQDLESQSVAS
jgi:prefoldin subunit 5